MSINLTFLMHDLLYIKKAMCPDDETLGDDACGFTLRVRNSSRLVTNTLKTFMVIKPRPITDQCALTVLVWVHTKMKSEGVAVFRGNIYPATSIFFEVSHYLTINLVIMSALPFLLNFVTHLTNAIDAPLRSFFFLSLF